MANIIISYHAGVSSHDSLQHLSRFVNAALEQQHTISGVFLYQDAVFHASNCFKLPSDELQINTVWQHLAELGIKLTICITAAEKRGLDTDNIGPFQIAGRAEFAMDTVKADKWLQIK